mmetsp:Transcript_146202/g.255059  ORF Transcript_146202/g.255059 Transcript_146202/m.255059 type:complete len:98 (-) Transcript_146202:667-960(-)
MQPAGEAAMSAVPQQARQARTARTSTMPSQISDETVDGNLFRASRVRKRSTGRERKRMHFRVRRLRPSKQMSLSPGVVYERRLRLGHPMKLEALITS